ncbi:MAG: ribbon-helix-helix domain-containing protein [Acidiphilium sp.]|nr:ribbon-helix-helix domain-containing protein [Acidiphilium sp.]MDD4935409.1 ribbon-helix-helix domain-containing protein [Acidiphilium sp.]
MLEKRSLSLSGHRTSIALEPAFWVALEEVAARLGLSLPALIQSVDDRRAPTEGLASALRVYALTEHLTEQG